MTSTIIVALLLLVFSMGWVIYCRDLSIRKTIAQAAYRTASLIHKLARVIHKLARVIDKYGWRIDPNY